MLAAEFALGLRDPAERDAALRADPAIAREIMRWEDDLARLGDELEPVAPSPEAWAVLQAAVAREAPAAPAREAAAPVLMGDRRRRPLLESLGLWRALAGAGFATAAVLAVLLFRAPGVAPSDVAPPSTARLLLVSPLLPRDGPPTYVATYDAARATILVVPAATSPVAGRVPRLWLVPNDTGEPIALGSLDPERPHALTLTLEQARFLDAAAGLVITLEAAGGASTGPAQGPVIAHGRFTAL